MEPNPESGHSFEAEPVEQAPTPEEIRKLSNEFYVLVSEHPDEELLEKKHEDLTEFIRDLREKYIAIEEIEHREHAEQEHGASIQECACYHAFIGSTPDPTWPTTCSKTHVAAHQEMTDFLRKEIEALKS